MSNTNQSGLFVKMTKLLKDTLITKQQLKAVAGNEAELTRLVSMDSYIEEVIDTVSVDEFDVQTCSDYLTKRYLAIVNMESKRTKKLFVDVVLVIKALGEESVETVIHTLEKTMVRKGGYNIRWHFVNCETNNEARFFIVFVNHELVCSLEQDINLSNSVGPDCFDADGARIVSKYFFLNEIKNGKIDCERLIEKGMESIEVSKIVNVGRGVLHMSGFPFGLTELDHSERMGKTIEDAIHSTFFRLISGKTFPDYSTNLPIEI